MSRELTYERLEPFGIEIDLDLSAPLSVDTADAVRRLMREHSLLLFRHQRITIEDQVRLVGLFGMVAPIAPEGLHYALVSNVEGESRLPFHSDLTYTPCPYGTVSLSALEVDGTAAPTQYASPALGYSALPHDLRARISSLNSVHMHFHFDGTDFVKTSTTKLPERSEYPTLAEFPRTTWPVVRAHPETGIPTLFVSQWFSHNGGWDEQESEALLDEIFAYLYAPRNVYDHYWLEGDTIVWDNLSIQHSRPSVPRTGSVRTLRKVITVPGGRSLAELYETAGATLPDSLASNGTIGPLRT